MRDVDLFPSEKGKRKRPLLVEMFQDVPYRAHSAQNDFNAWVVTKATDSSGVGGLCGGDADGDAATASLAA